MSNYHISVLLNEVIEALHMRPGAKYIDATLGAGGHTLEILKRGGTVLGIDADDDALQYVRTRWEAERHALTLPEKRLTLAKGNFSDIGSLAKQYGFETVDGILFDLGVSSHQIDDQTRGFSFLSNGPLDMRMDTTQKVTARDLINVLTKKELKILFEKLGEEHRGEKIAAEIVAFRNIKPIETTDELVQIIERALGYRNGVWSSQKRAELSKRVFQALRIAVNDELGSIERALPAAVELLASDGAIAVITFHSLEDRIVKEAFLTFEKEEKGEIVTKKPIVPNQFEMENNPRSRSAKLRVFAKQNRYEKTITHT